MKNRIIAFVVLWTLLIGLPLLLGAWGVFLLVLGFGMGTLMELITLVGKMRRAVDIPVAYAGTGILLGGTILLPPWIVPPFAWISIVFAGLLTAALFRSEVGHISAKLLNTTAVVFMIGLPFMTVALLMHEFGTKGIALIIWLIAVAKFTDVGALLVGTAWGKHRMAPLLSPKKTWEGLIGGLFAAILVSVIIAVTLRAHLPELLSPLHAAWMALPVAIAAVLADLLESAFKREANVKDSGRIIPGIGGFFDLTDSLLLAFPVGYFLVWSFA